ncbi:MAG TPA: hypothetical protein VMT46_06030 [Anaerolineaceae bacterium]|nr:hypothetical protein [Anaerolineaceae bacterium]
MAKAIGVIASIAAIILWIEFIITIQQNPLIVTRETWLIGIVMIILAVAGGATALAGRPFGMILVFVVSFFPVGVYLLGVPSIFRLIGIADLFWLMAGILLLSQRYRVQRPR